MAAASDEAMKKALDEQAELMEKYGTAEDRESAFEQIAEMAEDEAEAAEEAAEEAAKAEEEAKAAEKARKEEEKAAERAAREAEKTVEREERAREKQTQDVIKNIGKIATSFLGAFGRDAAKEITRGLFGTRRR